MKINVICQYYPPEIGAPQARLSEMACLWKKEGHEVTILTGFPNHPTGIIPAAYKGRIFMEEFCDGISIWRHWLYATPNEGFFKKTFTHISFAASLIFLSLFRGRRPDVYIVSSPNFFSAISAYVFSRVRRVPFIFEIRDLWPAIFVDLGVLKNKCLIRKLEKLELFLYRKAVAVVPVTRGFAEDLVKRGIPNHKIEVITNGVDLEAYKPQPQDAGYSRRGMGYSGDDFVALYIGAHGISHGLLKVLEAAEGLKREKGIHFLFVGEGAVKKRMVEFAGEKKLNNVTFLPGQKRERVADFYRLADVCLVPLRDVPGLDNFIPSKMFEIMACGRPIIGSLRGEAAGILKKSQSAVVISPEKPEELISAIRMLRENPNKRDVMGRAGRRFVETHYDRNILAGQYLTLMRRIVNSKKGNG